jgi:hypothetical protein
MDVVSGDHAGLVKARKERGTMQERTLTPTRPGGGGGGPAGAEDLEQVRAGLDDILSEADRILDNLRPINAEEYLQQNRQRGGE